MNRTIILGAVAVGLVAIIGFVLFFRPAPEPESGPSGSGFFGSLFPFGFMGNSSSPTGNESLENASEKQLVPRLRKVSDEPVAGGMYVENDDGSVSIRYAERATGHVYETNAENLTAARISNTTVHGIQEVLWVSRNNFLMRYLNARGEIETFFATLTDTEETQSLSGKIVPSWDRGVLDPERESLFSARESSGGSVLSLSNPDGSGTRTILSSPIRSWVPLASANALFVATAPAYGINGFLYRVSGQTLVRVLGNEPGLMAKTSSSGRYVLVSSGSGASLSLFVLDTETRRRFDSPLATLAAKCAFLSEAPVRLVCGVPAEFPEGEYPTDWLLGRVSTSDDLWSIEVENEVATLLSIPEETGIAMDVSRPEIDASGSYFGFINKNDLSLWSFRITEPSP